jgi:hypothetical protein
VIALISLWLVKRLMARFEARRVESTAIANLL